MPDHHPLRAVPFDYVGHDEGAFTVHYARQEAPDAAPARYVLQDTGTGQAPDWRLYTATQEGEPLAEADPERFDWRLLPDVPTPDLTGTGTVGLATDANTTSANVGIQAGRTRLLIEEVDAQDRARAEAGASREDRFDAAYAALEAVSAADSSPGHEHDRIRAAWLSPDAGAGAGAPDRERPAAFIYHQANVAPFGRVM